ncbi:MAG: hypothetical protein IKP69_09325 [Oscillospiraceae bacterium]|nr:hypothetical protein [Oscillospiraceae bacterium]
MKKMKNLLTVLMAVTMIASTSAVSAFADEPEEIAAENYAYTVDGENFSFYDYQHQISITDGTLKNSKDISFYGLNDAGNLAVVYFNVEANEGKSVVAENDSMIYTTYANGEISEVSREVGTMDLFGFDMSLADSSMEGMMKVFNASLGGFLQAYSTSQADYSAISNYGDLSGTIEYVQAQPQDLILMDDNYITNPEGSADEAFMANEWGIYSGYQVLDDADYSSFCFFGTQGDVYYYGYAKTETGFKVVNMKGTVTEIDDRTKQVSLQPVDMRWTSDDASQYITKMASNLMAAQGKTSLNLDTLELYMTYRFNGRRRQNVIEASTSTASGTLVYQNGVYTGTLEDENGNTEILSVKPTCWEYIVTSQTSGVFTVDRYIGFSSSLADSNPTAQCNYYYYFPTDWFWNPCWNWGYGYSNPCNYFDWSNCWNW